MNILKFFLRKAGLTKNFYNLLNKLNPTFDSLNAENLIALTKVFRQKLPPGDYYEFGVYKGFSLWFAYKMAQEFEYFDMNFFGFDSFEGMPEIKAKDRQEDLSGNMFAKGNFAASLEFVKSNLKKRGVNMEKVKLVKGFYEDSLKKEIIKQYEMKKAAVILVDCDLYSSSLKVLQFILPLLQKEAIILFDDYGLIKEAGQKLAVKEWLEENKQLKFQHFCDFGLGRAFKVKEI